MPTSTSAQQPDVVTRQLEHTIALHRRLDAMRAQIQELEMLSDPIAADRANDPHLIGGAWMRIEARVYRCSDGVLVDWRLNTNQPYSVDAANRSLYARAFMASIRPMKESVRREFFRSLETSADRGMKVTRRGRPWIPLEPWEREQLGLGGRS